MLGSALQHPCKRIATCEWLVSWRLAGWGRGWGRAGWLEAQTVAWPPSPPAVSWHIFSTRLLNQISLTLDFILSRLFVNYSFRPCNQTDSVCGQLCASEIMADSIVDAAQKHPAPEGLVYTYGTAGVSRSFYDECKNIN